MPVKRITNTIVLVACLFVWLACVKHLFGINPWPDQITFFSDTSAYVSVLLFVASAIFWTVMANTGNIIHLSTDRRMIFAKLVDFLWYPAGILSAIFAISSASANHHISRVSDFNNQISILSYLHTKTALEFSTSCQEYEQNFLGYIEIYVKNKKSGKTGSFANILDRMCNRIFYKDINLESYPNLLAGSKISRTICQREFKEAMQWDGVDQYGKVITKTNGTTNFYRFPEKLEILLQSQMLCQTEDYVVVLNRALNEHITAIQNLDFRFRNPWIWIIVLVTFGGLKISKSATEMILHIQLKV